MLRAEDAVPAGGLTQKVGRWRCARWGWSVIPILTVEGQPGGPTGEASSCWLQVRSRFPCRDSQPHLGLRSGLCLRWSVPPSTPSLPSGPGIFSRCTHAEGLPRAASLSFLPLLRVVSS